MSSLLILRLIIHGDNALQAIASGKGDHVSWEVDGRAGSDYVGPEVGPLSQLMRVKQELIRR